MNLQAYDEEVEKSVLAAILREKTALSLCRPILSAQDFYSERAQTIFATCLRLQDEGIGIDFVTVGDALKKAQKLEFVGGRSGLAELAQEYVSLANLGHHCDIVRGCSKRRSLIKAAHNLYSQACEHPDPDSLISEFHGRMLQVLGAGSTDFVDMPEAVHKLLDVMDQRKNGKISNGIPTGLRSLDNRIAGWKKGQLILIAARPSMGKTSLACQAALSAAETGANVGVFSLEMGAEEIIQRFLALSHDHLTMKALTHATLTDQGWRDLVKVSEDLGTRAIKLCDVSTMTIEQIKSKTRLLKMRGQLDLLIIDYLQLLSLDERGTSRQESMARVSRELKLLAKELNIAVIALSQLNRKCEDRDDKRPHLADLRESGALEQDADLILMLYRDDYYKPESLYKGKAEVLIRKNRNGPTGEFMVEWVGQNSKFKDLPENIMRGASI
ncbi:MAG: replicative DNA helicase [Nitrospira sp.]|nr:replicative DNA helicase [Nitrospira sp.]